MYEGTISCVTDIMIICLTEVEPQPVTVVMVPAGVSSPWVGNAIGPTLVRSEKSNGRFTWNNSPVMNLNPSKIMKS
jgi:hypothetical protein